MHSGKIRLGVYLNGAYRIAELDEVLNTNQIYNISGTYDGNSLKLYIDGELKVKTGPDSTISGPIGNPENNTVMAMGVNPNGSTVTSVHANTYANINIYSARIYERALTQSEIIQNINATK